MRNHLVRLALLLSMALLSLLPGCGGGGQTSPSGGGAASATGVPPEFNKEITALDGTKTTLAKYQGKVVLVNFWATWCEPCRGEIPWFIDFQKKYGPQGLVIVGIAMDEEGKQVVEPWVKKERFEVNGTPEPINYEILLGNDNLAEQFGGLIGMPTSMLYSRDGKKVKTMIGVVKRDELTKMLDTLL
jgi:cytochrome c biogenesis protein CcmG/thiol:disulfide interchange protein DsbE